MEQVVKIDFNAFQLMLDKIKQISCKECQCELVPVLPDTKIVSYSVDQAAKTLKLKIDKVLNPRDLYLLDATGITLPIGIEATNIQIIFSDNTSHKFTGPFNNSFTSAEFRDLLIRNNGYTTILYDKIGDKVAYWPVPLSYACKEV
ncbi:MAG: hypothetical protein ACRDCW_06805 [Sarcina sp.]